VLTDDALIVKYKSMGMTNARISCKMGIPTEEVERRWRRIVTTVQSHQRSGTTALVDQMRTTVLQYQLVGESLKVLTDAFANAITPSELRALISDDPEQTVQNLFNNCILLRPFIPSNPADALLESQQKQEAGN